MNLIEQMIDWLLVRDYDRAKEESILDIITRQSRGNVLSQDGAMMDRDELDKQAKAADFVMQSLGEKVRRVA